MEVHAHSHTQRKKWTHYFWEFLMLFLAVFCGFTAENLREHKVEKERAKQYIRSFYEDLKTDTGRLAFYLGFDGEKIEALADLKDCYDTVSKDPKATSSLLRAIKSSAINRPFLVTARTINQLSNAGGFRLLKKEDADSIISYQKEFNNFYDFQATVFQATQDKVRTTFDQLANFTANVQMFKPEGSGLITSFHTEDVTEPVLFSDDKALLNRYFNELLLYYRVTYNHRRMMLDLKGTQLRLIRYFREKYHFE